MAWRTKHRRQTALPEDYSLLPTLHGQVCGKDVFKPWVWECKTQLYLSQLWMAYVTIYIYAYKSCLSLEKEQDFVVTATYENWERKRGHGQHFKEEHLNFSQGATDHKSTVFIRFSYKTYWRLLGWTHLRELLLSLPPQWWWWQFGRVLVLVFLSISCSQAHRHHTWTLSVLYGTSALFTPTDSPEYPSVWRRLFLGWHFCFAQSAMDSEPVVGTILQASL